MHTNPELLALLALGEDVGNTDDREHVRICPDCAAEVNELAQLAGLGRSARPHEALSRPGPQVWERVRAELGFDGLTASAPTVGTASARTDHHGATAPRADQGAPTDDAQVLPFQPRSASPIGRARQTSLRWVAVAAVLALIAGIGIGLGWQQVRQPNQTVIANAELAAFPKYPGSRGDAVVETEPDGTRYLVVEMSTADPVRDLQVWMIQPSGTDMRSMGFVVNGSGRFKLPPDMSLSQFPIVDVSDEPLNDGNPAHSGNTVVRGTLDT